MDRYKNTLIALPSLTYAMAAEKLLRGYNINAKTVKLDPFQTSKGCGNGIELDKRQLSFAKEILIQNNIPVSEVV